MSSEAVLQDDLSVITCDQIVNLDFERLLQNKDVIDAEAHGRSLSCQDLGLQENQKEAFSLISSILQMHFKPEDPAEPYGAMYVLSDRRSMIPGDIRHEQAVELAKAVPFFSHVGIKARIADVAWLLNRQDKKCADLAIKFYREAVGQVFNGKARHEFDDEPSLSRRSVELLRRAFQISKSIKGKNEHPEELVKILQDVIDYAAVKKQANLYCWALTLACDYGVGNVDSYAELAENAAYWDEADHHWAKSLLELAVVEYRSQKKPDEGNRCIIAIAEKSVEIADAGDGSSMYVASWLMTAISEIRKARGNEAKKRAGELRKRLREVQEDVHFEMGTHTYEVNLTDIVHHYVARVKNLSWGEVLGQVACLSQSPDPQKMAEEAEKILEKHPLSSMFPSHKLDGEGKVISRSTGMTEDTMDEAIMDQIAQSEAHRRQIMVSGAWMPVRSIIQLETTIMPEDFMVICDHSPFVPEGYEDSFALGFARFFQGDMISAANILIPLLENSLRYVLKTNGRDTSKIESDMTQEDSAISRLLDQEREPLEAIFGKSIVFEIDLLFNHRAGPRIRHEHAHGKLSAGHCNADSVIYACWFLYRLVCIPLFGKWKEIAHHVNERSHGRQKLSHADNVD